MNIGSLCTREVITIDGGASLAQAAALMRRHHVGALVVTGETELGTAVVGVVTDRDLVVQALAGASTSAAPTVGALMHAPAVTVGDDSGVGAALEQMQRHGLRRLLVTDAQGQLVGIVSLDDIVAGLAAAIGLAAQVIGAARDREARERAEAPPPPPLPRLHIPAMGTAGWKV